MADEEAPPPEEAPPLPEADPSISTAENEGAVVEEAPQEEVAAPAPEGPPAEAAPGEEPPAEGEEKPASEAHEGEEHAAPAGDEAASAEPATEGGEEVPSEAKEGDAGSHHEEGAAAEETEEKTAEAVKSGGEISTAGEAAEADEKKSIMGKDEERSQKSLQDAEPTVTSGEEIGEREKSIDKVSKRSSVSLKKMRSSISGDRKSSGGLVERTGSKAQRIVGSTISIRRLSIGGEMAGIKGARYMNTYKLDADNPFKPEKVQKVLESVMVEALENLTYDPQNCPKQAKWASGMIRTKVKELQFDRYKLVCLVSIGEKNSQDVFVSCRFLWDSDRDRYATYTLENSHVFGIAQCFGLYYE